MMEFTRMIAAALLILFTMPARSDTLVERGRYLVETIAACGNCHTPKGPNGPLPGKKLAGGDVIKHQDFTVVVPNITPDQESGIGKWTDDEIISAIREGRRPDGSLIGPAMPSRSYRSLGDEDVQAIAAYLRAVPAVRNPITAKSSYDRALPASWGPPVGQVVAPSREDKVAYGGYLAGPVARCMDCHTEHHDGAAAEPGTGGKAFYGPWGVSVSANITPDKTDGIGDWTDAEVERAIRTGIARDGHKLFPPMPFASYAEISTDDMAALIAYLRSLPPAAEPAQFSGSGQAPGTAAPRH
jgi:mono/diheme cytochrome c family protein